MTYPGGPGDQGQNPPPFGQNPQYGQNPPPFGQQGQPQYGQQPSYGQPQYGQQPGWGGGPGGPSGPGGPGYGGGPYQPPAPPSTGNRNIIIAIVAVLVLAGAGVGIYFATKGSDSNSPQAGGSSSVTSTIPSGTGNSSPTSGDFPSTSFGMMSSASVPPTQGGGGTVSETDARSTAEQYLNDLNSHNTTDAATLICAAQLPGWQQSIGSPDSDFNIHVNTANFKTSAPSSSGLDVTYRTNITLTTQQKTGDVDWTFTVISEAGAAKICAEHIAAPS